MMKQPNVPPSICYLLMMIYFSMTQECVFAQRIELETLVTPNAFYCIIIHIFCPLPNDVSMNVFFLTSLLYSMKLQHSLP